MFVLTMHEGERNRNDVPCTLLFRTKEQAVSKVMRYVISQVADQDLEDRITPELTGIQVAAYNLFKHKGGSLLSDKDLDELTLVADKYFSLMQSDEVSAFYEICEFPAFSPGDHGLLTAEDVSNCIGVNLNHLPISEINILQETMVSGQDGMLWDRDCGIIVKLYEEGELNIRKDCPRFNTIVMMAHNAGYRMVDFDADGVIHGKLAYYENKGD